MLGLDLVQHAVGREPHAPVGVEGFLDPARHQFARFFFAAGGSNAFSPPTSSTTLRMSKTHPLVVQPATLCLSNILLLPNWVFAFAEAP